MSRRKFLLQATGAAVAVGTKALPAILSTGLAGGVDGVSQDASHAGEDLQASVLPEIPSLDDLASEPMVHRFGEPYNPPE